MRLPEHVQRRCDVAAHILTTQGYAAFLRFMARNKAAHAATLKREKAS